MQEEWPLWRLWLDKGVPIKEIQEQWTLEDVLKANAILDMKEAYETGLHQLSVEELDNGNR